MSIIILLLLGVFYGVLSGFLGVGAGFLIVPQFLFMGLAPIVAVGSSSLAVFILSTSATYYYFRQGFLEWRRLFFMAIACIVMTQVGVYFSSTLTAIWLVVLFDVFLILSILLVAFKARLRAAAPKAATVHASKASLLFVGGAGGLLAGMFGVGGGIVLVPLQIALLKFDIKTAVPNSLFIVMIGSLFATIGHALNGNVMFQSALYLGIGGLFGAQLGARLLPKLSERIIRICFIAILAIAIVAVSLKAFFI